MPPPATPHNLPYDFSRQDLVGRILVMVASPLILTFLVIHLTSGEWIEAGFLVLCALVLAAIWLSAKDGPDQVRSLARLKFFLILFLVIMAGYFFYTSIVIKQYSRLIWLFPMPVLVFFALGRRAGAAALAFGLVALTIALREFLAQPQQLPVVPTDAWRFIAVFAVMGMMGFFMERELRRERGALLEKQEALERSESMYRAACLGLVKDIGQRNQVEQSRQGLVEQLRQSQKMEALGQLAGGIAHDLSNTLGSVMGFTHMAHSGLPASHPQKKNLSLALRAADQAQALLRRLLDFSRLEEPRLEPVNLGQLLHEALELVRPLLAPSQRLHVDLTGNEQDGIVVEANSVQIEQVLFNLCQNASQAMNHEGGTLSVELRRTILSAKQAWELDLEPAAYALLRVRDTGPGLSKDAQAKAFEPFFTTKVKGEGTGMGLFVCRGIVEAHGGRITARNHFKQGARFEVYLPLSRKRPDEKAAHEAVGLPRGKGQMVLYVDDDENLSLTVRVVLEELGYQVALCRSGEEALEILDLEGRRFDLVISDHHMAGMSGGDLAKECRRLFPELPVIITTGQAGLASSAKLEEIGVESVLAKPVSARQMAWAVSNALENSNDAAALASET
jgi:signal transduction histidine kinase/CheY-like chemotaxis protein